MAPSLCDVERFQCHFQPATGISQIAQRPSAIAAADDAGVLSHKQSRTRMLRWIVKSCCLLEMLQCRFRSARDHQRHALGIVSLDQGRQTGSLVRQFSQLVRTKHHLAAFPADKIKGE